jgi:hypothetical protein
MISFSFVRESQDFQTKSLQTDALSIVTPSRKEIKLCYVSKQLYARNLQHRVKYQCRIPGIRAIFEYLNIPTSELLVIKNGYDIK